ncbi:FYVE, RhoGEF and PH domain-containing protein 4-like [Montipora capricornis]|uniref:FYVE, RhoGEF and PH domain-containing protein 4-like n=1 Tax=Montipora capricornis TaxID=246305 RepID=UPI0035F1A06D
MKKTERFKILLEIQDRIGVDYPLITASREFVMEGEFKKVAARTSDSHQERTLMLFNDVLLCCAKFPGTNKYKVKVEMDLYGMEVKTEDEDLEVENAFRIISKQRVMDFTAPNAEARETFVNKLQETVDELASKRESYRRARNIEVLKEGDLGKKAPTWVRDEAVSMCMLCDVMFTRFRRRHHCRACGRVVCGNCSGYKAALEYKNGKLEKVCEVCHRILVKGSTEEKAKEAVVKGKSILKIDSDKRIWHSGYLSFKMKGDKAWQKRWFVLSSDFVLFRYKAKKDIKAELNLPLPGHFVDKPSLADDVDRGNVFKVHHKNVRVYLFQAENKESMNRWMELLTKATKAEQVDEEQVQGDKKLQRANSE